MSYRGRFQRSRNHSKQKEESAELVLLRANHSQNLLLLNELFPDWSDEDLLFTLQDTYGDLDLTVSRISEGFASKWGEVKYRKPKKTYSQNHHPTYRTSQAPKSGLSNSQISDAKKQSLPKAKSVYHTDEKGLLVPAISSHLRDSTIQPSSEETLCETLDLPTNTDWAQDLPSPLMTTYTDKTNDSKEKERERNSHSEGKSNRNTAYKSRNNDKSEQRGERSQGSTRGQKSRGRGGKFSQGTDSTTNNTADASYETSRRRNGQHSARSNKNIIVKEKEITPSPKPALVPVNTWAKIASRATQTKVTPAESLPEDKEVQEPKIAEDTKKPISSEPSKVESTSQDTPKEDHFSKITSESISSGKEFSALALIESLTNSDRQQVFALPKPSSPTRQISGVLIPNITAAKMGDISRKFGKMNLSDLGFDVTPEVPAASLAPEEKSSVSNIDSEIVKENSTEPITEEVSSIKAPTTTSDKPVSTEDNAEQPTTSQNLPEIKAPLPEIPSTPDQDSKPKAKEQTFTSPATPLESANAQASVSSKPVSQAPASSQPSTTAQTQDSLYQQPMNQYYQHSQGYSQMPMHSHGAPGHQVPMQGQMMHPQGQANYMTYYPYPYAPSPYNPYQTNNYTHQFAQKSLNGNYEDTNPSSFGPLAQGAGPSHPQENNNVTNHSYDKSTHSKHKGYPDPSSDSGIPGHGPPMNYAGFGYAGMPNYQPSGAPGEGPIYYPHPYYTQPNHHTMFPGYPGSTGLQHAPPHLQQNYGNPHPLQQHHQGHQSQTQQQTHYSSHQQTSSNTRYQNWNN